MAARSFAKAMCVCMVALAVGVPGAPAQDEAIMSWFRELGFNGTAAWSDSEMPLGTDAMRRLNRQAYRLIEFFDDESYSQAVAE